jgi:hypothetical protein
MRHWWWRLRLPFLRIRGSGSAREIPPSACFRRDFGRFPG